MPCIFCDENNHFSQNCNIYVSNEERENILKIKNRCIMCTTKENTFLCCYRNKKCYTCFSSGHHTVYCPDRLIVSHMFVPNIDKDLLPRFFESLALEEKYSIMFTSPNISNAITLKPLKIKSTYELRLQDADSFADSDVVVGEEGFVTNEMQFRMMFKKSGNLEEITTSIRQKYFRIQNLELSGASISSDLFLHFLSTKSKKLECLKMKFLPKLCFREVIKKAPNLEIIEFCQTNIEVDNSWPDDLLKYNHALKMEKIWITITDLNFNIGSLALLMKKSVGITVSVKLPIKKIYSIDEIVALVFSKFSEFFIVCNSLPRQHSLQMFLSYICNLSRNRKVEIFNMKTR